MLKSEKLIKLIQEQVAHELSNHVLYVQFSSLFKAAGMVNSCKWFKHQSEEELEHYNICVNFLNESGIEVDIREIKKENIPVDLNSEINKNQVIKLFESALRREIRTTEMISDIVKASEEENDYIVRKFAEGLLYKQLQEEDEATDRLIAAKMMNDLLVFDMYISGL